MICNYIPVETTYIRDKIIYKDINDINKMLVDDENIVVFHCNSSLFKTKRRQQ